MESKACRKRSIFFYSLVTVFFLGLTLRYRLSQQLIIVHDSMNRPASTVLHRGDFPPPRSWQNDVSNRSLVKGSDNSKDEVLTTQKKDDYSDEYRTTVVKYLPTIGTPSTGKIITPMIDDNVTILYMDKQTTTSISTQKMLQATGKRPEEAIKRVTVKKTLDSASQQRSSSAGPSLSHMYAWCKYDWDEQSLRYFLTNISGLAYEAIENNSGIVSPESVEVCDRPSIKYKLDERAIKSAEKQYGVFRRRAVETMELLQNASNTPCAYNVSIKSLPSKLHPKSVVLEIKEGIYSDVSPGGKQRNNSCVKGGTTFRVNTLGPKTRGFCNTKNLLNGTYHVLCPIHEKGTRVTITVIAMNFATYASLKPINKIIYSEELPKPFRLDLRSNSCSDVGELFVRNSPVWTKVENGTDLVVQESETKWGLQVAGCTLQKLKKDELETCVGRFNNVVFYGDSHSRYHMYYMLGVLEELSPTLVQFFAGPYKHGNIAYRRTVYTKNMAEELSHVDATFKSMNVILNGTAEKPDLLVVTSGHWDIRKRGYIRHIVGMEAVLKEFSRLKMSRKDSLRIIWVGTIPFPDKSIIHSQGIMAVNGWEYKRLAEIGIEVFDTASILYPFNNMNVCGEHYTCIIPNHHMRYGKAGFVFQEMLLRFICKR